MIRSTRSQTLFLPQRWLILLPGVVILFSHLVLTACSGDQVSESQEGNSVLPDTLRTENFETVIGTDAGIFSYPVEVVCLDENRFAVFDFSLNVVKVLTASGTEQFQFGGTGQGPGEWGEAANSLNYADGRFLITDLSGLRLNIYDQNGEPLTSYPIESWARYASKYLIDDSTLLLGTNGRENALALLIDIQNPQDAPQKIGSPELSFSAVQTDSDFDQIRQSIISGEVPARIINETVLTASPDAFYLFMNALGELRRYDMDGVLVWANPMPGAAKDPLHTHYIERNENAPAAAYAGIQYAAGVRYHNNRIYILTTPAPDIPQHLLIYSTDGRLVRHIVLDNNIQSDTAPYFGRFDIMPDGTFILPDVRNAQLLTFRL